jgi:hypothetical protein
MEITAKYIVIKHVSLQELVIQVNHWILQGYKPLGGISLATIHVNEYGDIAKNGEMSTIHAQALILE